MATIMGSAYYYRYLAKFIRYRLGQLNDSLKNQLDCDLRLKTNVQKLCRIFAVVDHFNCVKRKMEKLFRIYILIDVTFDFISVTVTTFSLSVDAIYGFAFSYYEWFNLFVLVLPHFLTLMLVVQMFDALSDQVIFDDSSLKF